jgi:hypothetical protein
MLDFGSLTSWPELAQYEFNTFGMVVAFAISAFIKIRESSAKSK